MAESFFYLLISFFAHRDVWNLWDFAYKRVYILYFSIEIVSKMKNWQFQCHFSQQNAHIFVSSFYFLFFRLFSALNEATNQHIVVQISNFHQIATRLADK